jgi:hypothetical protein
MIFYIGKYNYYFSSKLNKYFSEIQNVLNLNCANCYKHYLKSLTCDRHFIGEAVVKIFSNLLVILNSQYESQRLNNGLFVKLLNGYIIEISKVINLYVHYLFIHKIIINDDTKELLLKLNIYTLYERIFNEYLKEEIDLKIGELSTENLTSIQEYI